MNALESRPSAIEQQLGTGPGAGDLDEQIAQVRRANEAALDPQDLEHAGSVRDRESQLLAGKIARQQQWQDAHPDHASLAGQVQRLSGEVERLRGLLRCPTARKDPGDRGTPARGRRIIKIKLCLGRCPAAATMAVAGPRSPGSGTGPRTARTLALIAGGRPG